MATYWSDMADDKTCVYRLYIGNDLAYVGMTRNPAGRFSKHACQKWWWADVTAIKEEWFENRTEAKKAEAQAIVDEDPIYNLVRPQPMVGASS